MIQQFKAARKVGTPLIAIRTFDPAATINAIRESTPETSPVVQWDMCRGFSAVDRADTQKSSSRELSNSGRAVNAICGQQTAESFNNPVEALLAAAKAPEKTVVFVHNAQRFLSNDRTEGAIGFVQALWNLRDLFKQDLQTIVLLGPSFALPPELAQDILELDEPLPDETELRAIVDSIAAAAAIELPEEVAR